MLEEMFGGRSTPSQKRKADFQSLISFYEVL